jgi:hypothetical protein
LKPIFVFLILTTIASAQPADPRFFSAAADRADTSLKNFSREICNYREDRVSERVLREYGSVFVATEAVVVPTRCVFEDDAQVTGLQNRAKLATIKIGNTEIALQQEAMRALLDAIDEGASVRLKITPLDGSIAGIRSYQDTVRLWNSRFYRALDHWQRRGRISKEDADAARLLSGYEQVPLVLKWEEQRLWFSTGFNRSILSSVAAPGTSQHLSGLAFDIVEYRNARVRSILNKHGWFQTVLSDEPHFTYLGRPETDLPKFGLISKTKNGYKFWVPAIP